MNSRVRDAMAAVRRADFLPAGVRCLAEADHPLPIGHGATNSQPWTVRYMLEHLDAQPGDHVLDVGSGSGWTTAILAELVGNEGSVVGVDVVPELVAQGRDNLGDRWPWARIELADPGVLGRPEDAPFDRILVSADGGRVPDKLTAQLASGGRMVCPAAHEMWVIDVDADGSPDARATGDLFSFVRLV